jgi:hypothetical protein
MAQHQPQSQPPQRSYTGLLLGGGVVAVLAAVVGGVWTLHPPADVDATVAQTLQDIPDVKTVKSEAELEKVIDRLIGLRVPERASVLRDQLQERLTMARALEKAARQLREQFTELTTAGREVLSHQDAPNLPGRAKAVLDRGAELTDLCEKPEQPLPGAPQLTYANVLSLEGVAKARMGWDDMRRQLRPLAALKRP